MSLGEASYSVVAISAGTSDPSTTRMLADQAAAATVDRLRESGRNAVATVIELAPIAGDIARSLVAGFPTQPVQEAIEKLAAADALIASTPVYKAGISGLFKSFIDLLDNDLIIATPVLLAATAGSERHAMVLDDQLRPLFAFFRTIPAPTSVFAAPDDWGSAELGKRIDRAAGELAALTASGVGRDIAGGGWAGYQHSFAGNATRAEQTAAEVDFDTDLMRLARGGN
ncbi:NADH-dependent FMN reductase [Gordonia amarae]|uniref:NADH-dependent FMN reductase n=2 Tax=Gordonia amarae TaxID=36821 RepID=A0A857KJJ0_9ACTN|nr:CE1759 family FMN reductase [Gordonia amarae]MCS3879049.1 FMN reductase [Gordonia amarae]QHN17588.1 NADH-dependent FMN reductase [Gordonia amarae]QHN22114.1 NADH-dependent FMN reductase [Gordonia amarae]QHN30995.1 NADH-dependent FMN reductase [Gordonia amarae]QHN39741.1 NADH-dependent FMN reductase [Gordonia amarae]